MSTPEEPAPIGRRHIGATLGRMRRAAGRTVAQAADHLDCPAEMIERSERGQAVLRLAEVRALLELYEVADAARAEFLELVRKVNRGNWWRPYSEIVDASLERQLILEDESAAIRVHQPNLVPGLLQTERYAWELMTTVTDKEPAAVRRRVELRIQRQQVLGRPGAPALDVILDEAALRRPVGGADVMREQYERVLSVCTEPNVVLRIVPFPAGPTLAGGLGFHVFSLRGDDSTVVQLELLDREYFTEVAEEVDRYVTVFDRASALAMTAERSHDFVADLLAAS